MKLWRRKSNVKEFYNSNADFKAYVDKYCKKHKYTVEEALEHALVKDVYEFTRKGDVKFSEVTVWNV